MNGPDSVEGVVAEIFRDPRERTRFSGGGGVVAEYQKFFVTFHIQGG